LQEISKKWAVPDQEDGRAEYAILDINQLSEKGYLRAGCASTCQWTVGNEVFSINLRAEAEQLRLSYTMRVGGGKWEDVAEVIRIVHLPCRFGGNRVLGLKRALSADDA
jgi:hypothetical protein